MNSWMKKLAEKIRSERLKRRMSQEELADLTNMNTSYISRLEKGGSFQSVKLDFFLALVKVFEWDLDDSLKQIGLK